MSSIIKKCLLAIFILFSTNVSNADDLEILNTQILIDANILFVMDLSGSMDYPNGSSSETRLEVLSGAFQDIIDDEDFKDINIGLTTFSGAGQSNRGIGQAHGITYPVSPMTGTPAQDILSRAGSGFTHRGTSYMPAAGTTDSRQYLSLLAADTNIWSANGSTPIVDALYEASLYFRGLEVDKGKFDPSDIRSAHPSTYIGSLTAPSTPPDPVSCAVNDRTSCDRGFCNSTMSCSDVNTMEDVNICPMVAGVVDCSSCDLVTGNTLTCETGELFCGTATSAAECTTTVIPDDRSCSGSDDVAACETANPDWYDCVAGTEDIITTNTEGESVITTSAVVNCKIDLSTTVCDAADTYSCPSIVEECTECPQVPIGSTNGAATYISPIVQECAANAIILLTDGAPTSNTTADKVAASINDTSGCNAGDAPGRCGPELAEFMSSVDHSTTIDDVQNVKTYGIGLDLDVTNPYDAAAIQYLNDISMSGNGNPAIIAGNRAELVQAFKDSINDAVARARSFSAPSYSVDKSTLLNNGTYVYLPVFDRSTNLWPGNLKKYKLVNGILVDADNNPALDANNALLPTARDLWSANPSTDVVESGGAANKIVPTTRNIYTDDGNNNRIDLSNAIDNDKFGLGTSAADTTYKDDLVKFIKGQNPSDDSVRNHMGDIIHSKPVQLELAGGRKIIFVGTNEGYLHAINDYADESNVNNGTEAFAYMPQELLKKIKDQYEGTPSTSHNYGVDGLITVWIDESANTTIGEIGNGIVDVANGEKAYIFFGLRRGGGTYTAMDVTDPDDPVLKWSGSFGTGNSWSQPVVANLKWGTNATEEPVIVIGGGFNDDATGTELAGGNNVYVINAMTGDIVWDTSDAFDNNKVTNYSGSALPNAVPSRIRVIDFDKNNSIDRLYFGDTGGNIWRVDLNAAYFDADATNDNDIEEATLHRFAALGGSGVNDRKFFEEPDVAIFKNGGKLVASVAIGSGNRPNPLEKIVEDKFFVLYDKEVIGLPTAAEITLASGNVKAVPVSKSDASAASYQGWQKSLDSGNGEKILSSALTFQGKVLFTSFATTSITPDACTPSNTNVNKVYVIDLFAGSEDGVFEHPGGEILTTPKIIYPPGETCAVGNCSRIPKIGFGRAIEDFPTEKAADGTELTDSSGNAIPGGGNAFERVYWIDSEK